MRQLILVCMLLTGLAQAVSAAQVPEKMDFCGIRLSLNADARDYIGKTIDKLKRSPTYFQSLVDKAGTFMPVVEEAFETVGTPSDLVYVVLQESALRGDAVSTSNAVGFWQFKEPAAREVGLVIDRQIDERMHIYRASVGAARYLYRINRDFDNWVYAVIGYNRGPYGAIAHTDKRYYGAKAMPITGETHWYALKAIAHKLAFEEAVQQVHPATWLEPQQVQGGLSVKQLARDAGVSEDVFRSYNLWIRGSSLPDQGTYTVYFPREGKRVLADMKHTLPDDKQVGEPGGGQSVVTPPQPPVRKSKRFTYLDPAGDPEYGVEYVRLGQGQSPVEVAVHYGIKAKKLRTINEWEVEHRGQAGEVIYLRKAKKRKYHIVAPGESLSGIAQDYDIPIEKLRKKNRMGKSGSQIFAGQKLYLKKKKPKKEKVLILEGESGQQETQPPVVKPAPRPKVEEKPQEQPGSSDSHSENSGQRKHRVSSGETLWAISRKYDVTVDAIKRANRMQSNEIMPGQVLVIPASN